MPAVTVPAVGFNPFREQDKSRAELIVAALAVIATVVVIAWAISSG